VSGSTIIEDLDSYLRRYVVFVSDAQVLALCLWVVHTHAFEAADATPYPLITSPEKRSGKSRLLEVLELVVARGWRVAGVSEAVLYRKIEQQKPTLLLDELDAIFGTYAEKTEPIRGAINAGSRRGGAISRCVGPNHDVEDFSVFCPKCLAGINSGQLPETIRDRSIPIGLHRKVDEPIERFRYRHCAEQAEEIASSIGAWVEEHLDELASAEPDIPDAINDRAAEGWEPLLAIADLLGADVGKQAREAAVALSVDDDAEEASFGAQLLADILDVWPEADAVISSADLCHQLKELEDRPWGAWGQRRPSPGLTPRDLAKMLRPYGLRPRTMRISPFTTAKGYSRADFIEPWRRYVPETDDENERG
jgi:hypothetical protein